MRLYKHERVEQFYNTFGKDQSIEEKFPDRKISGYVPPMHVLLRAINWIWLKYKMEGDFNLIKDNIAPVICRAINLNSDTKIDQKAREEHDFFLIHLAIIHGNHDVCIKVANCVIEASEENIDYQYYHSLTGILKYRILGDEKKVKEQYALFRKYKILRTFLFPTQKMVDCFVQKDYKSLHKVIKQRCELYWGWAKKVGAISEENGEEVLNVSKISSNFFWPWVECTFAKLSYIDGADFTYDSFWLPLDLVKTIE